MTSQGSEINLLKRPPTAQETSRKHILKPAPTDKNTDKNDEKRLRQTGETSKRGGSKLEGQENNLACVRKQQ